MLEHFISGRIAEMIEVSEEEVIPEAIAAELKGFQNLIPLKQTLKSAIWKLILRR